MENQKLLIQRPKITAVLGNEKETTSGEPRSIIRSTPQGNPIKQQLQAYVPQSSLPSRIKYTMDNTGDSVNSKNFYMFDNYGACVNVFGSDVLGTAATPSALTNAIINGYMGSHQIEFSGFRAQATTSSDQFSNQMNIYRTDLDGKIREKTPIYVEDAVAGTTYDNKIQNFAATIVVDAFTAIGVAVNKSEKLVVSWFISADFNRS